MPPHIRKAPLLLCALAAICLLHSSRTSAAATFANGTDNLAPLATPSTSFVSPHENLDAINSGYTPRRSRDHRNGAYGDWPRTGEQWVEYQWSKPISTNQVAIYWWQDGLAIKPPLSAKLLYWNGADYLPVPGAQIGVATDTFNTANFPEITTDRLRLVFTGTGAFSTGILQWKVIDSGKSPALAPIATAGNDRVAFIPSAVTLDGRVKGATSSVTWSKLSGPGNVTFNNPTNPKAKATFSQPGTYKLRFDVKNPGGETTSDIAVTVNTMPESHLDPVFTTPYSIDSPLWNDRFKQLIVHWIPHVIDELSKPDLKEGGIDNFVQAANALAGRPYKPHVGAPFADAFTHNAVESMCVALEIDPKGDPEIIAAQKNIRDTLDKWIPIILSAQEPDGYLQTRITLGTPQEYPNKPQRWTMHGEHEGYVSGYFIDAAIADYLMTGGTDRRMYDAAKRLADCWYNNIGPAPKRQWWDGHEEIEQSLVNLGRLVDKVDGPGKGDHYIELSKYLLSCRGQAGGTDYDQTQAPVTDQYYAAGHAVRAVYLYSAMTDIAMETKDPAYHAAVGSIWNNLVNRKYYVTGGVGSGETSEGFGKDFSLPNNAYCESCSGCGEMFFQHNMNLAYADARYIDLLETTLYNAVLSDIDLEGNNFTYTNPLDTSNMRYPWHVCPCCVGNIARTWLEMPTWMYATGHDSLYVNLFVGSTVHVDISGKPIEIKQITNYPQTGHVELQIDPGAKRHLTIYVRVPDRSTSELYTTNPKVSGIESLAVNGTKTDATINHGYVRIERDWSPGDKVTFDLPMEVQRIHADNRVIADRNSVALQYGPLVYTIEAADQTLGAPLAKDATLTANWQPNLLNGVTTIQGTYTDGTKLTAIPYYTRNNRGGRSMVWIPEK